MTPDKTGLSSMIIPSRMDLGISILLLTMMVCSVACTNFYWESDFIAIRWRRRRRFLPYGGKLGSVWLWFAEHVKFHWLWIWTWDFVQHLYNCCLNLYAAAPTPTNEVTRDDDDDDDGFDDDFGNRKFLLARRLSWLTFHTLVRPAPFCSQPTCPLLGDAPRNFFRVAWDDLLECKVYVCLISFL